jgi:hypothetical protein
MLSAEKRRAENFQLFFPCCLVLLDEAVYNTG